MSTNLESEMEEGEIVDELDDLSDISSEEEFLLRQRLEVLENYNNVLERKKVKRSSSLAGIRHKNAHKILPDLSEISATELEDSYCSQKKLKQSKHNRFYHKQKKKNTDFKNPKKKGNKRKISHNKKKVEKIIVPESSDESEDEYKHKRIKLANAVNVNTDKIDKSSLSVRLKEMFSGPMNKKPVETVDTQLFIENNNIFKDPMLSISHSVTADSPILISEEKNTTPSKETIKNITNLSEFIDRCADHQTKSDDLNSQMEVEPLSVFQINDQSVVVEEIDTVDSIIKSEKENVNIKNTSDKDSDEDLELLRQNVLKTKVDKRKEHQKDLPQINYNKTLSDDDDSDTSELRLICLRSALLKKAIEMKQKQKLQKRLSQSTIEDGTLDNPNVMFSKIDSRNNTDTESVDMEIGSDDEKTAEREKTHKIEKSQEQKTISNRQEHLNERQYFTKDDEFDEDEDLLRAKLLTSLSRNLPNIINPVLNKENEKVATDKSNISTNIISTNLTEEKKFIIELRDSESEGEHEATRNLTKMHMKLSEQIDFQQKLDMFLKCTRLQVENSNHPVIIEEQHIEPKKTEKFVAKAVNNLPKSEQIEYKNLVKRMAELEKIKQLRQMSVGIVNKVPIQNKETLKPNSITNTATSMYNNLEQHIITSRKKIAEESAKMMKLKQEATKLSQKYKIVATELRNITTAIALNKKQQRLVQNYLTRIRLNHQTLLKRSTVSNHSKLTGQVQPLNQLCTQVVPVTKLQKENDPKKDNSKNFQTLKTVKINVLKDNKEATNLNSTLSIQVKLTSNNNCVKKPKSPDRQGSGAKTSCPDFIDTTKDKEKTDDNIVNTHIKDRNEVNHDRLDINASSRKEITICNIRNKRHKSLDDYQSPLQALGDTNWEADPNAILCPFEVGGECKDTDCKYLHTKTTQ